MDPQARFSNRVETYVKYRPGYPPAVIDYLRTTCGLTASQVVGDIGSGTGILTELFLKNGNPVFGVEPNAAMRAAGEQILHNYPKFTSVAGSAEATTLPDASVDFVTAAQAFHWFDKDRTKAEFARILKPNGWAILLWNERRTDSTPFLRDYEALLLKYGTDYQEVRHENVYEDIAAFFAPNDFQLQSIENQQVFDYEGLQGRLLSSSYVPAAGQPGYSEMLQALRQLFDAYQKNDRVVVEYDTRIYAGRLNDAAG